MSTPSWPVAAASFRHFFSELREAFFEREGVLAQIELALLCREHVLIVGPPGTAKSALASAVLGRIVDARTGLPSLFAKQLSESTMQADLIGPVDFKVLTETGRTEHITEDGMLGATHAFLDEVFDGRDMLLRSILNVLHERELKHGRKTTIGKIECAIMTSNRYLSEVVARSPELLWAFADRLSFVSFVPKAFARPQSRAAMLTRANRGQRFELEAPLTLQELDALQALVERVEVPSNVVELLEGLADELERTLGAQAARLTDYVPTKSFSQRSIVKALWALKGAVIRDAVWHRPHRALLATSEDLDALRAFFVLGGPPAPEVEALLKIAVDARERSQLEAIRFEHRAFDEALAKVRGTGARGAEREAEALQADQDVAAAESLSRSFQLVPFHGLLQRLRAGLVPGPRHPDNREPLLSAARLALSALTQHLADAHVLDGDLGSGRALGQAVIGALSLAELVPELRSRTLSLSRDAERLTLASFALAGASAEGRGLEGQGSYEALLQLTRGARDQLGTFSELGAQVVAIRAEVRESLDAAEASAREQVVLALHRHALEVLRPANHLDSPALFLAQSRKFLELDRALGEIAPLPRRISGVRDTLLAPIAREFLATAIRASNQATIGGFSRSIENCLETIRREGLTAEDALLSASAQVNQWLSSWVSRTPRPEIEVASQATALEGGAYADYHDQVGELPLGAEVAGLDAIDAQLGSHGPLVEASVRGEVARHELAAARVRGEYIRAWYEHVHRALPEARELTSPELADAAVSKLVQSRLIALVLREGELLRVSAALGQVAAAAPVAAEEASGLRQELERLHQEVKSFSQLLLERRSGHLLRAHDHRAA